MSISSPVPLKANLWQTRNLKLFSTIMNTQWLKALWAACSAACNSAITLVHCGCFHSFTMAITGLMASCFLKAMVASFCCVHTSCISSRKLHLRQHHSVANHSLNMKLLLFSFSPKLFLWKDDTLAGLKFLRKSSSYHVTCVTDA